MTNLKALKEVEKKLARRYNKIQSASGYEPIGTEVLGLIELVLNTPILKETADRLYILEDGPTFDEWKNANRGGWLKGPVQRNKKARLCYEMLARFCDHIEEPNFDFNMEICHIGLKISRENKFDICAREYVDNFVDPFVDYLDEELEALIADEKIKDEDVAVPRPENKKTVFIVHGRDKITLQSVVEYLKQNGLMPLTFEETKELVETSVPTILEVVDKGMAAAQAVIVLLTPDDEARLKESGEESKGQARPNVIFEAGIAFGRYRKRTVLVEYEEPSMFSDLHGFYVVRLKEADGGLEGFQDLRKQLKVAGCELD
jgi:predicted nucleotide-binding protein